MFVSRYLEAESTPLQGRRGPARGRSHSGESGRGKRDAVSSPVPMEASRTSALLVANARSQTAGACASCFRLNTGM